MKKILRIIGKFFLYILGLGVVFILLALLVVKINSSEKPEPIVDSKGKALPNSITIIKDTVINGAAQRLTIRGNDISNPVLLRVHGGPGEFHMPQFYRFTGNDLEDIFTVCYWDQRGSGPAYSESIPDSTITLKNIVKDGVAVAGFLSKKFGKDKIFIEGTSWGTVVSAFIVEEKPQLFQAYFGVAQMSDQIQNEILSYEFALSEARERKDTLAIKTLEKLGSPPYPTKEEATNAIPIERSYVAKYSPSNLNFNNNDLMKLIFLYDGWSMDFKWQVITEGQYGKSAPILWEETMVDLNLINEVSEWQIPVYIFHGSEDHFAVTSLSKSYFDSINAPLKEFFLFEGNGHFVSAENPEKYRALIKEILNNFN